MDTTGLPHCTTVLIIKLPHTFIFASVGSLVDAGYVRVFERATGWLQLGNDIIGEASELFGFAVALSKDGNTIAVGGSYLDEFGGIGKGIGVVRVFQLVTDRSNRKTWEQIGQTLVSSAQFDNFGLSVALNDDGTVLAVGAPGNDSFDGVNYVSTFELIGPPTLAPIRNELPKASDSTPSPVASPSETCASFILGIAERTRDWISTSVKNLRGST
jgi:hypothetical protein